MFSRTENFHNTLSFTQLFLLIIALNVIIHVLSMVPVLGTLLFNYGAGANYLNFRWTMVAFYYTYVFTCWFFTFTL